MKNKMMLVVFGCLLTAICLPTVAAAGVVTTVTTFDHDGDGFASGNGMDTTTLLENPDVNASHWTSVTSRTRPAEYMLGWLRFDISQVTDLNQLFSARLQFYDYPNGSAETIHDKLWYVAGVSVESAETAAELDWTWNNSPATYDPGTGWVGSNVTDWGTITTDTSANDPWSQEVDLSGLASLVQADTNGLVTVGLYHLETTSSRFASEEAAQAGFNDTTPVPLGSLAPRLILEGDGVGLIPEPSSLLMIAIGGLWLSACCRKHRR